MRTGGRQLMTLSPVSALQPSSFLRNVFFFLNKPDLSLAQFFAPGHKSLEISGYALWIQVLLCDRGGSMLRSSVLKMLPSSFCRRQSSRVRQQLGLSCYKHEASGQLSPVVPCDLSWTLGMGGHNSSMPRTRPALTRRPRMEELGFIPSLSTFKYCVPACLSPVATIYPS